MQIKGTILLSYDPDRIGKEVLFEWDEGDKDFDAWTLNELREKYREEHYGIPGTDMPRSVYNRVIHWIQDRIHKWADYWLG